MTISERFHFKKEDLVTWAHNTLLFLAPLATLYLVFAIDNMNKDGFSWSDLQPNLVVIGSMVLYVFNCLLDLARKFIQANTYK